MNSTEYPSPLREGWVEESVHYAPPPSASPLLSWMHVIYHPDHDTQNIEADASLSAALEGSAAYSHTK